MIRRIFCVGRNYAAHAREMGADRPSEPVIFMKPASAIVEPGTPIRPPATGEVHFEAELVLRIGREPGGSDGRALLAAVDGVALGLDLTRRDVQARLKKAGLPWEAAKAFDGSAPLGEFAPMEPSGIEKLSFECRINGELRQSGRVADMLFPPSRLLAHIATLWRLRPGDAVYTGTPEGVGPLHPGDRVELSGSRLAACCWEVV